jgi:transposase
VTEHQVYRGWCSYCRAWREAPLDLHGQVLGQGRLGVGIASLVAHLRTVVRAPIRMIQAVLLELYGLRVSVGELVDLLRRVAQAGQPAVADLRAEARASPALHADETGWRENGRNGYIWSLATKRLRYFEYHQSRAGAVVRELLGSTFEGVLESDFYAAYNEYAGLHQRCWVHLLRDIHHLKEQHPTDEALLGWAAALKDLYHRACAERGPDPALPRAAQERLRRELQHAYEQELWHVCAPYLGSTTPMHTLCKRVERFLPELFVFLLIPEAVPDNNEAERSVRPLVIARKISGGSRSPQGSRTRMVLSSLFGTWQVRGLNPREECHHLLSQQSPTSSLNTFPTFDLLLHKHASDMMVPPDVHNRLMHLKGDHPRWTIWRAGPLETCCSACANARA